MNRRDVTAYGLLVFAAAGLTLALVYPAASDSPWDPPIGEDEPAHFNGAWYDCWNAHGYPLPQAGPICPEGWAGRAPENPLPVDVTQAAPPPIAAGAVARSASRDGGEMPDAEGIAHQAGKNRKVLPSSPGAEAPAALPDTGGRP